MRNRIETVQNRAARVLAGLHLRLRAAWIHAQRISSPVRVLRAADHQEGSGAEGL